MVPLIRLGSIIVLSLVVLRHSLHRRRANHLVRGALQVLDVRIRLLVDGAQALPDFGQACDRCRRFADLVRLVVRGDRALPEAFVLFF